jgi:hypothetical protein
MKLILCLVILLIASPHISSAAPSIEGQNISLAEVTRLINEGDDAQQLAAYLGDRILDYSAIVDNRLVAAIRLSRPESFQCLFQHTRFLTHQCYVYSQHLARFLSLALLHHQPGICDFLLAVNWPVLLLDGWDSDFWNQTPFLWTVEELIVLARRFPRFASFIAPMRNPTSCAPNFEAASRMLDFVEQLQGDNLEVQKGQGHPTELLAGMMLNEVLSDAEMATLFARLLQLGAEPSNDGIRQFVSNHPNHEAAYRILLDEPETKEPAESKLHNH